MNYILFSKKSQNAFANTPNVFISSDQIIIQYEIMVIRGISMAKKSTESKPKASAKPAAESKPKVEEKKELHLWRCTVCGWTTSVPSAEPPEVCPQCGAKKEDFEIAD